MVTSSSSDDEDLAKFKEAADSTLYNDILYKEKQGNEQERADTDTLPSLRHIEEKSHRTHDEVRVTPAFQKHVAKHLTKLLDRQLEINETSTDSNDKLSQARSILKAKRGKNTSSADAGNSGGVRLFGASAVFLSSLNIVPTTTRRRKRGRKIASFSSGSESSSEDSDSDNMQKLADAVVSSDWVLSGTATKGWTSKGGKIERCVVNKSGVIVPIKDDVSRGYESLNEISCSNNNSKEALNNRANDDMAVLKFKTKKGSHLESELAASFSSVVSIGSDSQNDITCISKKKKFKKKKKHRKEQHSEDATTETTEVEDTVEERKKKVKKGRRKAKRLRIEEKKTEEEELMKSCVPGLLDEENDQFDDKLKHKEKKKKKKRKKEKREESFLKKKSHSKLHKRGICKKKMSRKVLRLSEDLAKLMMTPNEAS